MKCECEVIIDLPRERMIELFDNPENLPEWQEGLNVFERFEGEEGQPGAKTRMLRPKWMGSRDDRDDCRPRSSG